jgi:magnesium transporter
MVTERFSACDLTPERVRALLAGPNAFWVDVDSEDPKQHALLENAFAFHPLAIEDTLNPRTRVKVEEYDEYVFIVLRSMRLGERKTLDPSTLGVKRLCLFLGRNYLVSVHAGPSAAISEAVERLERDEALRRESGPDRIAYSISDAIVDAYFPILDDVDHFAEMLEHRELSEIDETTFRQIMQVRRIAAAALRGLRPHREIFDVLAHRESRFMSRDVQLYFRDVYDHALRTTESFESFRGLIADLTDNYSAQLSIRVNNSIKVFSAIATVIVPFLVISGLYGMNFTNMPLTTNPVGFGTIVGIQALISLGLVAVLRWRNLL